MKTLTPYQQGVYVNLSHFARDDWKGEAKRYDLVAYCMGYYGSITAEIYEVINLLFEQGIVEP